MFHVDMVMECLHVSMWILSYHSHGYVLHVFMWIWTWSVSMSPCEYGPCGVSPCLHVDMVMECLHVSMWIWIMECLHVCSLMWNWLHVHMDMDCLHVSM